MSTRDFMRRKFPDETTCSGTVFNLAADVARYEGFEVQ
jgi:hypothetical protein